MTEHHFEILSLKGEYTGSSESTLVKMPCCWKSHVTFQVFCSIHDAKEQVDYDTVDQMNTFC